MEIITHLSITKSDILGILTRGGIVSWLLAMRVKITVLKNLFIVCNDYLTIL